MYMCMYGVNPIYLYTYLYPYLYICMYMYIDMCIDMSSDAREANKPTAGLTRR